MYATLKKGVMLFMGTSMLLAYHDFGVAAETYDIKERSLQEEYNASHIDKKAIHTSYEKALNASFTGESTLPKSYEDKNVTFTDYSVLSHDVYNYDGTILKRKGEKVSVPLPKGIIYHLCYIDANEKKEVLELIIKEFGACSYIVANKDIRKLPSFFTSSKVEGLYPFTGNNVRLGIQFKLTSFPTKFTLFEDKVTKSILNVERLYKELK